MRSIITTLLAAVSLAAPWPASAEVEWTADLSIGGGVVLEEEAHEGVFRFGAHTEVTFLRRTNRDFGLGVYGEVMTSSFRDVMASTGLTFLIPIHHGTPLVVFCGPHYTYSGAHDAGIGGRLWWGFHNHNHHHPYNGTVGIWVEARGDLTGDQDVLVAAGLDIDLAILVYPFLYLDRWARGPTSM